jgi:hypothetical protein
MRCLVFCSVRLYVNMNVESLTAACNISSYGNKVLLSALCFGIALFPIGFGAVFHVW